MPPRDPSKTQADFPELVADLIEQLRLTGQLGVLDFTPVITPVFIVGDRNLSVEVQEVTYNSSEIFDGTASNPAANLIIVDTGQLAGGVFDFLCWMSHSVTTGVSTLDIQHMDAANAVILSKWGMAYGPVSSGNQQFRFSMAINQDERLRCRVNQAATGRVFCTIMARLRPTP